MGTPSSQNGVIALSSTNPSITGNFEVSGFVVNPTAAAWSVQLDSEKGRIFSASGSAIEPFSHTLPSSLPFKDITGTTLTNVIEVLVYLR